jgi:hypothetical protein
MKPKTAKSKTKREKEFIKELVLLEQARKDVLSAQVALYTLQLESKEVEAACDLLYEAIRKGARIRRDLAPVSS